MAEAPRFKCSHCKHEQPQSRNQAQKCHQCGIVTVLPPARPQDAHATPVTRHKVDKY